MSFTATKSTTLTNAERVRQATQTLGWQVHGDGTQLHLSYPVGQFHRSLTLDTATGQVHYDSDYAREAQQALGALQAQYAIAGFTEFGFVCEDQLLADGSRRLVLEVA